MEIKALTITQFLIQGDPDGLVSAYVSNWNGQCLKFPRNLLSTAIHRDEFKKPGIYFLIAEDLLEINSWKVYVGETEGLDRRLGDHDKDLKKDFWELGIVFSSKDEVLTKGHVRYLEYRLIQELKEKRRITLTNINATRPMLPEASKAEMETYLDFLKLLMPVLGFPFFEKASPGELGMKIQPLYINSGGIKSEGYLSPKGLVVKKGSLVSAAQTPALSANYSQMRQALKDKNIIDSSLSKFIDDYEFTSPSAAASVILGYNVNGRDAWKTTEGVSINQLEQIA